MRVTAQLIDAETGRHVWAERFDRGLADLFAVQDEIVSQVVGAIEPEMLKSGSVRARQKSSRDMTAWDYIFRGMWHFYQVTPNDHSRARELFRSAIQTAPALAEGYTWLARCTSGLLIFGWSKSPSADAAEGWQAAMRATRLAEADPYAHYALGIMSVAMGQPDRAASEAQKSIDLSPNFALGYFLLGMSRVFAGRAAQAFEPLERGLRLSPYDPHSFMWHQSLAFAHFLTGKFEEAARRAADAVAIRPDFISVQAVLACSLAQLGHAEEAKRAVDGMEQALSENPDGLKELLVRFVNPADRQRIVDGLSKAGWQD